MVSFSCTSRPCWGQYPIDIHRFSVCFSMKRPFFGGQKTGIRYPKRSDTQSPRHLKTSKYRSLGPGSSTVGELGIATIFKARYSALGTCWATKRGLGVLTNLCIENYISYDTYLKWILRRPWKQSHHSNKGNHCAKGCEEDFRDTLRYPGNHVTGDTPFRNFSGKKQKTPAASKGEQYGYFVSHINNM